MRESFGVRLRQRRERRHLSLTTISEQTKIKPSLLEALERNDTSNWPTGIFRRAFVRAYANALGLDPDEVLREFLQLHPDPVEAIATIAELAPGTGAAEPSGGAPPMRLRYVVGSVVDSLSRLWTGEEVPAGAEAATPTPIEAADAATSLDLNLSAAAELCTELGRLDEVNHLGPLLGDAAGILDAVGLVVWVWDPQTAELKPASAHGYSEQVLSQLPKVGRDAGNATAAAFRTGKACVVPGGRHANGALAVPLAAPRGCIGVLAVELRHGHEQAEPVRAVVTILAAQLARLLAQGPSELADRKLA